MSEQEKTLPAGGPEEPVPYIQPGKYKHFKGGIYKTGGGIFRNSETGEYMVEYISPRDEKMVRPVKMWAESVKWPDGTMGPRFKLIEAYLLISHS